MRSRVSEIRHERSVAFIVKRIIIVYDKFMDIMDLYESDERFSEQKTVAAKLF